MPLKLFYCHELGQAFTRQHDCQLITLWLSRLRFMHLDHKYCKYSPKFKQCLNICSKSFYSIIWDTICLIREFIGKWHYSKLWFFRYTNFNVFEAKLSYLDIYHTWISINIFHVSLGIQTIFWGTFTLHARPPFIHWTEWHYIKVKFFNSSAIGYWSIDLF